MKLLIAIIIATIISGPILTSCKVTEKTIPGVYQSSGLLKVQLKLKMDNTFEWGGLNGNQLNAGPGKALNDLTTGIWNLKEKKLRLILAKGCLIDDSITRFTNISCFNFWDKDGAPVSIRYILIPSSRLKPHFGNSLYFFSQDFKPADTLAFYFDGYPPFYFPGSIPATIGNNMHKITLQLPDPNVTTEIRLKVRKNRLFVIPKFTSTGDAKQVKFHRVD